MSAEAIRFLRIIIAQARRATRGKRNVGCLQVCTLSGDDTVFAWKRFRFYQSDDLIAHALRQGELGRNVFIEGRTIRRDARWRGKRHETCWVFALVVDSDGDKGRAWAGDVKASLVVETSPPNNRQFWFLLDEAITAEEAREIGRGIRFTTKTDSNTGVPVQPYRVAGLPNIPNSKKRARGRTVVATRILAHRGGGASLWTPAQLLAAFPPPPRQRRPPSRWAHPSRRYAPRPYLLNGTLTAEQICDAHGVRGHLRWELLHGRPMGEDRSRFHWKLACLLYELGVPAPEAFTLLTCTNWNKHSDDIDTGVDIGSPAAARRVVTDIEPVDVLMDKVAEHKGAPWIGDQELEWLDNEPPANKKELEWLRAEQMLEMWRDQR